MATDYSPADDYADPATFIGAICRVPHIALIPPGDDRVVLRCARPMGHLGDHADMNRHQWANTYTEVTS